MKILKTHTQATNEENMFLDHWTNSSITTGTAYPANRQFRAVPCRANRIAPATRREHHEE
jgi:hypothetical protein